VVAQFPDNNAARAQENWSVMKPTKIGHVFGERQLLVTEQLGERATHGGQGRDSDFGARRRSSWTISACFVMRSKTVGAIRDGAGSGDPRTTGWTVIGCFCHLLLKTVGNEHGWFAWVHIASHGYMRQDANDVSGRDSPRPVLHDSATVR
jgi:hypothetical protein